MERLQRAVAPDYRVERKLGVGGMGTVYLAHEVTLNRDVAIKVLRLERATAEGAESFHREAQTLASIRHPNVVVIYRPGQGEGLYFYIMELINGPTLENRLESGPLPVVEAVRIGIDVLRDTGGKRPAAASVARLNANSIGQSRGAPSRIRTGDLSLERAAS